MLIDRYDPEFNLSPASPRSLNAVLPVLEERLLRFPGPLRWDAGDQGGGAKEWNAVDKFQ